MQQFDQSFLDFFIDLAPNNHKDWFDENRKRYQKAVKEPMERFVQHLIDLLGQEEPRLQGLSPKNCIFRINRDIRFSKDKTPYKLNSSAVISPLGRKDHRYPGLYFELGPDRLAIAGGAYSIDKEALEQLRAHMVLNKRAWKAAAADADFLRYFPDGLQGEENKRLPSDLQAHAEELPLLFKKQLFYWREYAPDQIIQPGLDNLLIAHFRATKAVREQLIAAFGV
jgi:uncharacterized protein (TIGR02453 family)